MATGGQEVSGCEESPEDSNPCAEVLRDQREELVQRIDPGVLVPRLQDILTSDEEKQLLDASETEKRAGGSGENHVKVEVLHTIVRFASSNPTVFHGLTKVLRQPEIGLGDVATRLESDFNRRQQAQASGRNMPDSSNQAPEHGGGTTASPITLQVINNYHTTVKTTNVSVSGSKNVVVGDQNSMQVSEGTIPDMDEDYTAEEQDYTAEKECQDRGYSGQPGDTRVGQVDDDVIIMEQYEEEDEVTEHKRVVSTAAGDWTEPKRVDSGEDWGTSPKEPRGADRTREKTLTVEGLDRDTGKVPKGKQGTGQTDDCTDPKELRSELDTDVVADCAPAASSRAATNETRESRHETLTLRNYQKELAEPAIQGKNTIVCAPTGSGKTHVAMSIIKQHLDKRLFFQRDAQKVNVAKVLVLTPEVTILDQHYRTFCRYLPLFRTGKRSGSYVTKRPFEDVVESNDITVATPEILLNALRDKTVNITDFSLIVFDECHHTRKDAPYNKIMAEYLKIKLHDPQASLPQIVGLSASPGAGGKPDLPGAEKHLEVLIASLDAAVFKTVEDPENIKELEEKVNTPSKHTLVTGSRPDDPFRDIVEGMMKAIEDQLPRDLQLQYGGLRGVQEYQSAVDLVKKQATEERNTDVVQQCDHLLNYNKALQMNNTARMKDAMGILTDFYDELKGRHRISAAEKKLLDRFNAKRKQLLEVSQEEENYPNPKLVELEKEILKTRVEFEDELRGILFVKTRALTQAMTSWVRETPAIRFLNPGVLTGSSGEDVGRLTHGQQVGVIKKFNDGVHKLLIATSIAEEGLDIRDCNMVIKYNYATNEIAMVQARGRARAAEGKELVIADLHIAEKDRVNALTVGVSEKAIKNIQRQLHSGDLQQKVRKLQLDMVKDREEKGKQQEIKKGMYRASEIKLCCKGCPEDEMISVPTPFSFVISESKPFLFTHGVAAQPARRDRVSERQQKHSHCSLALFPVSKPSM
ncbi:PREDICTED: probable ATP-dependent RNA helicase DHX58 [Branchiostoma belcheri]|uniref:Activating signal cointegrator 1 complex subunit 3 n=1 Tax=Branchiostoma belcheri TaxID=7741 RepID=A0A6P4Z0H2_BRABE|nr:PREDICTED: probable ATP-dependent RNA helicase DHX58 [Branchiostoma belcheri]